MSVVDFTYVLKNVLTVGIFSQACNHLCHTSFSVTDQNKPDLLYGMSRANKAAVF